MSDKIIWWPASVMNDGVTCVKVLLMRYDWPDERIYVVGLYDPHAPHRWVSDKGEPIETPDYVTGIGGCLDYLNIPTENEFTYDGNRPKLSENGVGSSG